MALRESKWIRDLPNQLTLFRMAVVPLLLVLFPLGIRSVNLFCAFLFALAAISDGLDGFIARQYDSVTKLGVVLDPIADKMLTAAGLILLAHAHTIYVWMAGALLCRELAISGLRHLAAQKGINIAVSSIGKWKTFVLDVAITCMMVNESLFGLPWVEVGMICFWLSLVISLYSAWEYSVGFWRNADI